MKKIYFTLIMLCLFITPVRAFEMSLTGDETVIKSVDVTLKITNLNNYEKFYGLTGTLDYDNTKLELLEIKTINKFNISYSSKTKKIVLYSGSGTSELTDIIRIKFRNIGLKKDEKIKISINNIVASDSKKDIKVKDASKIIMAVSDGVGEVDDNLSSIKINGKSLDVNDGELNYDIVVSNDTEKIDINAIASNKNAKVTGNGSYDLAEGNNEIKITVNDGESDKTYTINVNRENKYSNIDEEDLFIKSKKFKWNNLYFIPIGVVLIVGIILIIKRKGSK